ncbi:MULTISPECIES: hypothetical protein [Catenuloplanes]|uniref:Uncharacterized protein n=1 Tax=Catenuloplanes niger TaxID=587534 RepID=A0AAE3ZQB6_9ACTN|nr:hypothetical protein [Catenuloplanes niger]MDR7321930.1 hypothetical protein [Catenuloplanes niger]
MTVSGLPSRLDPGPGDPGVPTEYDASTLESAITWLESQSDYLSRSLVPGMENDIKDWLTGPPGGNAPFGTFPTANEMAQRQLGHYQAADASIRGIADALWQAAQSLRVVLERYETAERANALSASSFEEIFTAQQGESAGRAAPPTGVPAAVPPPPTDLPVVDSTTVVPAVHVESYGG